MRKLLVGLGVLVVLLVAAAVIIPFAVPVEVYSARVAALVKQATGRELKIAGPVRLSVLPVLALDANDVSFANMPGADTPDMVVLKRLRLQVQLWPLLHRRIVVNRLVLVRPVIALEVDKAGHPNWVFGPMAAPSAAPVGSNTQPATVGGGFGISGLALRKVQFSDGKISYFDQRTGKAERLDGINMTLSLRSLGSALISDGSAVWNGETVTFAVSVDKPHALLYGAESQVGIKLAAAPLTLNFAGRVMGSPSLKLDGAIDLETTSLRRLAQWAGSPIALSGDGLGPFALKGTLAIAGTTTSFKDADISLDAIRAKGSVSVDNAGARPAVAGALNVDRLDLNPYLSPQTASTTPLGAPAGRPAPTSSAAAQNGRSDVSIDLSALKLADVDFDLKVGGIVYRQFQIGASAVGIHIKDARLTADLSRMALYRGNGHGSVTVDGGGAVPTIGLDAALRQVQIQPLAQAAIGIDRLTGAGNLDIAVTARGNSQSDLIGTLSGTGAINLANGQIKGVNLPALAQSTAKIERDLINSLNVTGALNLLAHGQINADRSAGARHGRGEEPDRRRQRHQFRHADGNLRGHQRPVAQQRSAAPVRRASIDRRRHRRFADARGELQAEPAARGGDRSADPGQRHLGQSELPARSERHADAITGQCARHSQIRRRQRRQEPRRCRPGSQERRPRRRRRAQGHLRSITLDRAAVTGGAPHGAIG